jgi:amidophosphoribosyltransferase
MVAGHGMLAFRDPHGIRPLIIGRADTEKGVEFLVASESVSVDTLGFKVMRDVAPGEAILVDESGNFHSRQCAPNPELNPCIFEFVYLARPDSVIDGISVHESRRNMGVSLADKIEAMGLKDQIDVVIPIPDSSRPSALEVATKLGKPYREGFIKNRYIGRTFIMPGQELRKKSVRQKLNAMANEFRGKNVLLVDDSIVRGTTTKQVVSMLREAGAEEVHIRITCPPVKWPCFYGIDFPTRQELIGADLAVEEIRAYVGAESLGYLSQEGMVAATRSEAATFCSACFDGSYPIPVPEHAGKFILEDQLELPTA